MKLSEYMKNQWLPYSIGTAEERAIPSYIDGLKPCQRFLLHGGYCQATKEWIKTEALGSSVAKYGYEHGGVSAMGALTLMAAEFRNNLRLFDGDGNFGNVLNPKPSAPRYTWVKLSKRISKIFKDHEQEPESVDLEKKAPDYYIPIIPYVLCNGIIGIATGYATNIFPYDPIDLIDILIDITNGKSAREPKVKFYNFKGSLEQTSPNSVMQIGIYEIIKNKVHITELPTNNTADGYDEFLDKLENKGEIVSYENNSAKGKFDFVITFKRDKKLTDEYVKKTLKLTATFSQNLTTISEKGKIRTFDNAKELIDAFYRFLINIIDKRIQIKRQKLDNDLAYLLSLLKFTTDVVDGKYSFKGKTEKQMAKDLMQDYHFASDKVDPVMNRPVRTFTKTLIQKLEQQIKDTKSWIKYYTNTTPEKEYRNDLEELKKELL